MVAIRTYSKLKVKYNVKSIRWDVQPKGVQNIIKKESFNQFSFLVHSVPKIGGHRMGRQTQGGGWGGDGGTQSRALTKSRIKVTGRLRLILKILTQAGTFTF
jgi:hypothetical protein